MFIAEVYVSHSGRKASILGKYSVFADSKLLFMQEFSINAGADKAVKTGDISIKVPKGKVLNIQLHAKGGGWEYENIIKLAIRQKNGFCSEDLWRIK